jgi:hypothetical protein
MAPTMLITRPNTLSGSNRKSGKAMAPITVPTTFFRLPATLVISGSL